MMWFSNGLTSPTEFVGLHLGQDEGAFVLLVMYPDGSQATEIFNDEPTLVEGAIKLHDELIVRGWQPWAEPARLWANES